MWAISNFRVLLKDCLEVALLHREININSFEAGEELLMHISDRSELQFSHSLLTIKWKMCVPTTYLKSHFQTE